MLFKSVKITEDNKGQRSVTEGRLRKCGTKYSVRATLDSGTRKGDISGKTDEIQIKSIVKIITLY